VFDLPQAVVEREMRSEIQYLVQESLRSGIDREKIAQEQSALVDTAKQMAQRRLRLSYILLRIADAEKIEATVHEVTARIERIARDRGLPVERARAEVEDRYGMEAVEQEIRAHKAMTWLLDHAQEA
jgi:FKBP-type peptidyl-prolyl cis-trans isomerase (trigger factor)